MIYTNNHATLKTSIYIIPGSTTKTVILYPLKNLKNNTHRPLKLQNYNAIIKMFKYIINFNKNSLSGPLMFYTQVRVQLGDSKPCEVTKSFLGE